MTTLEEMIDDLIKNLDICHTNSDCGDHKPCALQIAFKIAHRLRTASDFPGREANLPDAPEPGTYTNSNHAISFEEVARETPETEAEPDNVTDVVGGVR